MDCILDTGDWRNAKTRGWMIAKTKPHSLVASKGAGEYYIWINHAFSIIIRHLFRLVTHVSSRSMFLSQTKPCRARAGPGPKPKPNQAKPGPGRAMAQANAKPSWAWAWAKPNQNQAKARPSQSQIQSQAKPKPSEAKTPI